MKGLLRKRWLSLLAGVIIIAGGTMFYITKGQTKAKAGPAEITATVTKGSIRSSVSGTSQLQPKDMQIISAPSDGILKSINLTRNKNVKAGEVLLELSSATLDNTLQRSQAQLNTQTKELNDILAQQSALKARAPISGKITYGTNLDVGSSVQKTTKIATISDLKNLTVTLPFQLEDAIQFKAGESVDLEIDGFMLTKTGTVKTVGKEPRADGKGGRLLDVEVSIVNDDSMDANMKAKGTVYMNGRTSISADAGTIQYSNTVTVLGNTTGSIDAMPFRTGQLVRQGDLIVSIQNDQLKDDALNKQAQVDQTKITVDETQERVNALKILAPFDGVFSTDFVNSKSNVLASYTVGSRVPNATQFGGVASMETMQLPIQVDELDLPNVKVGMKAEVKVDSLQGRIFQAEVSQVSSVGTTTNGVTFYDVVLAVKNTQQLKYGMTATGEILIQDKQNILMLPIESLQSRQGKRFVTLKKADGTVEEQHEVQIGIRSKTHIEITEGLKEGDVVVVPISSKQQNLSQQDVDRLRQQFQGGAGGQGANLSPEQVQQLRQQFQQGGGGAGGAGGASGAGGAGGAGGNAGNAGNAGNQNRTNTGGGGQNR